jgi:predicted MFS family arabinose efflux permease
MAAVPAHEKSGLPPVVALLALGTFLTCTTELTIAGLLAQMALPPSASSWPPSVSLR